MKDSPGVYLDYAGAAIPPQELLQNAFEGIALCPHANPHTRVDSGENSISEARKRVLSFISADHWQYDVIFTSGATAAIKLVGEAFPRTAGSRLCYAKNSHTSVLGLRHFFDCAFCMPSTANLQTWVSSDSINPSTFTEDISLLALPAECNFSGCKVDLTTAAATAHHMTDDAVASAGIRVGKQTKVALAGGGSSRWLWLLDAAKLVSTSRLDLSLLPPALRPHFICLSFYKIFGYPTGLGCLVIRRDAALLLKKRYF